MRVYKPAYTKPLPDDANVRRAKDSEHVILKGRQGQNKRCKVIETEKGKRVCVESDYWMVIFRDHNGINRRVKAYQKKIRSRLLAKKIDSLVRCREQGEALPEVLQDWVVGLPDNLHKQLAGFGLLRQRRARVSQDLEFLLEAFEQHLALKRQRDPKYIRETLSKLRRTFKACGFRMFLDIDDVALDQYLIGLRKERNTGIRTLNGYVRSCQQFCRFAVRTLKVANSSPLECMESFGSERADRRRIRRALTAGEIQKLLVTTAQSAEIRFGMDGPERSMLYRFALMTGLRLNEIRTLRVEHLDLDHPDGPVLYVDAAYSKHRERDVLPLHRDLVSVLRRFTPGRGKTPQAKLFGGKYKAVTQKAAKMLRMDLADAGIVCRTMAGEVDFHALRHTYVSSLKSISARLAQGLARHKSSEMTDRYSHRSLAEQRAALESVSMFGLTG